jgi:hypothetical protein
VTATGRAFVYSLAHVGFSWIGRRRRLLRSRKKTQPLPKNLMLIEQKEQTSSSPAATPNEDDLVAWVRLVIAQLLLEFLGGYEACVVIDVSRALQLTVEGK